jgi:uncharacterized membrane protein HdeD (DUF308 family)
MNTVVRIIAVFLLASGLVSGVIGFKNKQKGVLPLLWFNAAVDMVLGLVLFMFPSFVAHFIIYMVGFVLLAFGFVQIVGLISARRVVGFGLGVFVLPTLVTMAGAFMLFNPFADEVMTMIAGIALIVYGASEILSSWKMKTAIDEYEIHQAPKEDSAPADKVLTDIKDVDYTKVDEQ